MVLPESHISFRQLRVYMAAHEMAERRRYTKPGGRTKPSYSMGELKALVGGRERTRPMQLSPPISDD